MSHRSAHARGYWRAAKDALAMLDSRYLPAGAPVLLGETDHD